MNVENLRRARVKRLGIKSTSYGGQRRIFSVLDRATRKFHGDTALWLQYLTFARKQKANKMVAQIVTSMLRLHPTSPELWIYAANYAWDERADVTETRGYMQRGLRFCRHSKHLWSEYLKLELLYIARIAARRQILGLDLGPSHNDRIRDDEGFGGDEIALAPITTDDAGHSTNPEKVHNQISVAPVLAGAIPMAVFDAAMKEFPDDPRFGAHFFDCVAGFHELDCAGRILQHIVEYLMTATRTDAASLTRFIHEPVVGTGVSSTLLPRGLMKVLDRFNLAMRNITSLKTPREQNRVREAVAQYTIRWIAIYLEHPELDLDIRAVLTTVLQSAWTHCLLSLDARTARSSDEMIGLLELLHLRGFAEIVQPGVASALRIWPEEPRLLALESQTGPLELS